MPTPSYTLHGQVLQLHLFTTCCSICGCLNYVNITSVTSTCHVMLCRFDALHCHFIIQTFFKRPPSLSDQHHTPFQLQLQLLNAGKIIFTIEHFKIRANHFTVVKFQNSKFSHVSESNIYSTDLLTFEYPFYNGICQSYHICISFSFNRQSPGLKESDSHKWLPRAQTAE